MSTRSRPRPRHVLGGAVVLGCLLIPARYTAPAGLTCASVGAPIQKVLARGARFLAGAFDGLSLWGAAAEKNRRLQARVAQLTEQLHRERGRLAEMSLRFQTLQELGAFLRESQNLVSCHAEDIIEAEVIGRGAGTQRGILFIDRGSGNRIRRGTVVVAGQSVVGRVRATAPSVSSVLLVTSPGSRIDGQLINALGKLGEPGIVVGNGDGTMRMKYVSKSEPQPGDGVLTRGRDGLTPKHLLLGLVAGAERRPGSIIYDIVVRPARDLDRLATVVAVKPAVSATDFPPESEQGPASDG